MKNMFREQKIKFEILLRLFLLLLVYTCFFFSLKLEKESSLRLKKVSAIVLHKMADAQSSEASVPGEPEAVPTDEPNRESIVASL